MVERKSKTPKAWSRKELLLAMSLYCRIPFGRQHSRAPEVIELARALERTPGSVAMKLNNFTSLDPKEAARGISGLTKASRLDKQIWEEFHQNWEELAIESEELWRSKVSPKVNETLPAPENEPTGPTEGTVMVRVRYVQNFFRRTVVAAYNSRCCISGMPVPELLIASHILPWSRFPEHRTNPRNGLCLFRLHDGAFDRGLIAFDEDNRLLISRELKEHLPNDSLQMNFIAFRGQPLIKPGKFIPDPEFLRYHREQLFRG